jgi:hypothetical protein
VARRRIDDHPADPAGARRFELGRGHLQMPVQREWVRGLSLWKQCRAKLAKSARSSTSYLAVLCVSAVIIALLRRYLLPRLACGERAGVRGRFPIVEKQAGEPAFAPHPESALSHADSDLSPQAGEVTGGAGNSFTGRLAAGPGTAIAHVAAQPRDQLLDHLFVGRAERIFSRQLPAPPFFRPRACR